MLIRGDSAFDQADVRRECEQHGAYYALVAKAIGAKPRAVAGLAEDDWSEYIPRGRRLRLARQAKGHQQRTGGVDERGLKVVQRGYRVKSKTGIEVAEVPYQPTGTESVARLIILRETLMDRTLDGQYFLLREQHSYRFIITNLPDVYGPADVVDLTYERCDQENVIEQFKNGLPGWHAPVREFDGNAAWLEMARLAWNLMKAVAILGLPAEAVRWEWKRIRRTVLHIAATVTHRSRQTWVRVSADWLHAQLFKAAHAKLCT
jgi:hypothetical protein